MARVQYQFFLRIRQGTRSLSLTRISPILFKYGHSLPQFNWHCVYIPDWNIHAYLPVISTYSEKRQSLDLSGSSLTISFIVWSSGHIFVPSFDCIFFWFQWLCAVRYITIWVDTAAYINITQTPKMRHFTAFTRLNFHCSLLSHICNYCTAWTCRHSIRIYAQWRTWWF